MGARPGQRRRGPPILERGQVRFDDAEGFLAECEEGLRKGRLTVQTAEPLDLRRSFAVEIFAPGVAWPISARARVRTQKPDGIVTLELLDAAEHVFPMLGVMIDEVEAAGRPSEPPPERTVLAPKTPAAGALVDPGWGGGESTMLMNADELMRSAAVIGHGGLPPKRPSVGATLDEASGIAPVVLPEPEPPPSEVHTFEEDTQSLRLPKKPGRPAPEAPSRSLPAVEPAPAWPESVTASDEAAVRVRRPPPLDPPAAPRGAPPPPPRRAAPGLPIPTQPTNPSAAAKRPPPRSDSMFAEIEALLGDSEAPPPPGPAPAGMPAPSVPPEPPPPPLAAPIPAAPDSPGPAALAIDVEGLAGVDRGLLRVTTGGVVRIRDLGDLLGVYLAELRHGHVTGFGGPEGAVGQEVKLKLAAGRVLTLDARIVARAGDFVTLAVPSVDEVKSLLAERASEWTEALRGLGPAEAPEALAPAATPLPPPVATPPPPPVAAPPPAAAPPPPRAARASTPRPAARPPKEPPKLPEPPPKAEAKPPAKVPAPKVPEPAQVETKPPPKAAEPEVGPPRLATIKGDQVVFDRRLDLRHELDTNLKNGGLFVASEPLAIREHRSLKVVVAGVPTGTTLEMDVVFAAGGRVGFSVGGFANAYKALDAFLTALTAEAAPSAPSAAPPPGPSMPPPTPSVAPGPEPARASEAAPEVLELAGKLKPPLSPGDLLDFPRKTAQHPSELSLTETLTLFEYLSRTEATGVLELRRSREESAELWLHQGGIAFLKVSPWQEETSLGRLLLTARKITEPALREALEKARSTRRPLGRTMVALKMLTTNVLAQVLRDQVRMKMEPVLAWERGEFTFSPWREPPTSADLVVTAGLSCIARYVRHVYEQQTSADMDLLLSRIFNRIVLLEEGVELDPALGLNQKEQRFLELNLDGDRILTNVLTGSPLGRLASNRLVALGLALGLLKMRAGRGKGTVVGAAPRLERTDGKGFSLLRRELAESLQLMRTQNHFEVIGVHWSAHPRTFNAAYRSARGRFDLSRSPLKDAPADVQQLAKEALEVLDRALQVLASTEERIGYRANLYDAAERELAADMLVKQGEVMVLRGDRMAGIEAFETAVELAPTPRNKDFLQRAREGRPLM